MGLFARLHTEAIQRGPEAGVPVRVPRCVTAVVKVAIWNPAGCWASGIWLATGYQWMTRSLDGYLSGLVLGGLWLVVMTRQS